MPAEMNSALQTMGMTLKAVGTTFEECGVKAHRLRRSAVYLLVDSGGGLETPPGTVAVQQGDFHTSHRIYRPENSYLSFNFKTSIRI